MRFHRLIAIALSGAALAAGPAMAQQLPDPVLVGAIDTHIHTEEEYDRLGGGSQDMVELARRARDKGMRAIVVKSLHFETATRAYLVQKLVPGIQIFGGLTLDLSVGGANPDAVEAFAKLALPTAKVVFMPVFESRAAARRGDRPDRYVRLSRDGRLLPNVLATLDAVKRHGFSLATAHLGADEALLVVRAARERDIPVVVTHAAQDPMGMTVAQMREVVRLGGFIEHTALGPFKGPQTHLLSAFYRDQRPSPTMTRRASSVRSARNRRSSPRTSAKRSTRSRPTASRVSSAA